MQPRLATLVLLGVLASACGSTVQVSGTAALPSADLGGPAVDGVTEPGASLSDPGTPSPQAEGQSSRPRAAGADPGAPAVVPLRTQGPPRAVTTTTIKVGIPYSASSNSALTAVGITAKSFDQKRAWQILVDRMNRAGGVLGRRIVPVFHGTSSSDTPVVSAQKQCAAFFQDDKVFAVMFGADVYGDTTLPACTHKNGGVNVYTNVIGVDRPAMAAFPAYVSPGDMARDRVAAMLGSQLASTGFYSPWNATTGSSTPATPVKVGVVYLDLPIERRVVTKVLLPELARSGHPVDPSDVVAIDMSNDASSLAGISNAVLRFQSAGVSHVLIFENAGAGTLFFTRNAQSQGYYPRYGFTTGNAVQLLMDVNGIDPASIKSAVGLGWAPLVDLSAADDPDNGPYANSARRRCTKVFSEAGFTFPDRNALRQGLHYCSELDFLKAALERSGSTVVSQQTFVSGVNRLGSSFVESQLMGSFFDATHHDGAAVVRPFAFVPSCSCFRYSGPGRRVD